jgi:hypothetical protein
MKKKYEYSVSTSVTRTIALETLSAQIPAITDEAVGFYKENCMVCFHHNGHESGVALVVNYNDSVVGFRVQWTGTVTDRMLRAYRETTRATDMAACAIALILVRELTEYTVVEQACIGTTIDYYLATQAIDTDLIFNHTARLEVSGILKETEKNTIEGRIKDRIDRLKPEGNLPDLITVVEFSKPWSIMVEA